MAFRPAAAPRGSPSWRDWYGSAVQDALDDGRRIAPSQARLQRRDQAMREDGYGQPLDVVGDDKVATLHCRPGLRGAMQRQRRPGAGAEAYVGIYSSGAGHLHEVVS